MSPILFALFLNDLNDFILEKAKGITLWDVQICALLYADDSILLAESEEDLQIPRNIPNGSQPYKNKSYDIFKI